MSRARDRADGTFTENIILTEGKEIQWGNGGAAITGNTSGSDYIQFKTNSTEVGRFTTTTLDSNIAIPSFHANLSTEQGSVTDNTWTKVNCDTEVLDTEGWYDNATNYRFTPQVAGYYFFYGQLRSFGTGGNIWQCGIEKNGTLVRDGIQVREITSSNSIGTSVHGIIDANGTTDYFEFVGLVNTSGTDASFRASAESFWGGYLIKAN